MPLERARSREETGESEGDACAGASLLSPSHEGPELSGVKQIFWSNESSNKRPKRMS